MKLTFLGANHEVTGSCTLLEAAGQRYLIDCGMEQGKDVYENQPIPVAPGEIDGVLATHAHIDHTGLLPLLVRNGFRGRIYATRPTAELCSIMLRDSAHIQEFEAEWKNRKGQRSGAEPVEPMYTIQDAEAAIALFRGYDVIHYHAIEPSVPLLIAKLFGKHTVCTVHGLNWKVDKWRGFASRYMKLGERIAAKYADDLVVLSETEWNYFLQKYGRASILIPNAIRFYEKRACSLIREKYGLEQGEYILYVGRISPEKGTLDLVEGYRKAKTGKKLVLVGPLDDSEYCRAVQQQAQNDPNIIMTDYVVGDPLKELYSNCGLFILPSHTEGLSLSLLEALSIGARCLVSDIPENTVVTDIYGAAFKPEDTDDLARALKRECTQEYPDAMRQQQIEYVHTNFEYDVMLDRYEEVYHHVVGDPLKAMPSTLKKKKVPAGAKA